MEARVNLPEMLFRHATERAAEEGRALSDLVEEGLRDVLKKETRKPRSNFRVDFPLIRGIESTPMVTSEMVKLAEDQLIDDEAAENARLARH